MRTLENSGGNAKLVIAYLSYQKGKVKTRVPDDSAVNGLESAGVFSQQTR
jgi:hypothetical protein